MRPRSLSPGSQRNSCPGMLIGDRHRRARLSQVLDLLAEDDRLNVYAGKLEVRPPGAPTTEPDSGKITCPAVDKHFATREELSSARTLFFRVGLPVHQQRVGAAALSSSVLMRNRPAGATSYLPALLRVAAA